MRVTTQEEMEYIAAEDLYDAGLLQPEELDGLSTGLRSTYQILPSKDHPGQLYVQSWDKNRLYRTIWSPRNKWEYGYRSFSKTWRGI